MNNLCPPRPAALRLVLAASLLAALPTATGIATAATATADSRLEISPDGSQVVVRWRVSSNSWQLFRASQLTPPVQWQPINSPVIVQDGFNQVRVGASRGNGFFQLQRPALGGPASLQIAAGDDYLYLDWPPVAGAAHYTIYLGTNSGVGPGNCLQTLAGITNTAVLVDGLAAGRGYCFTVTAQLPGGESLPAPVVCSVFGPRGSVLGQFCTEVDEGRPARTVHFVPGVTAWLSNRVSREVGPRQSSQSDGYVRFHDVPVGDWMLCWEAAGFAPGCSEAFPVGTGLVRVPTRKLAPLAGTSPTLARVQFADGSPVAVVDAFHELNQRPLVQAWDDQGRPLASAPVNDDGQALLLPAVQCCARITVAVEGAQAAGAFPPPRTSPIVLTIPNRPPEVTGVQASWNGATVFRAPPGAELKLSVEAADPDGQPLSYRWFASDPAAVPQPRDSANPTWTLPTNAATHTAYVRVGDGRGGYAFGQVEIRSASTVTISGRVMGRDPAQPNALTPLPGAAVRVAGTELRADASGRFSHQAPAFSFAAGPVTSFAVDIQAPGYLPLQADFADEVADHDFVLARLNTQSMPYDGGPLRLVDAAGNEVTLPARALLTSAGQPPTAVVASFTPLDPQADDVPITLPARAAGIGAAGGANRFAHRINLLHLDLRDQHGLPLQLAPGAELGVRLASSTNGLAAMGGAASPLTRATFDLAARRFGPGSTVNPSTGGGTVVYSSAMIPPGLGDLIIGDFIERDIAALVLRADRTLNHPYQIRVDNSFTPITILSDKGFNGIIGVGRGCPTRLRVLHLAQAPGEHYTNFIPVGSPLPFILKTVVIDRTVTVTSNFLVVNLSLSNHIPTLNPNRVKSPSHFLSRGLLVPDYTNNVKDFGTAYYAAIKAPASFKQWKVRAGFEAAEGGSIVSPPLDEAGAEYYNALDLGFARKMRMRKTGALDGKTNVFYYVTNYRTVEDAIDGKNPIATVAMDFAALPPVGQRFTRFYVYDGATEQLLPTADLDGGGSGGGQRAIPNLCVVCHGGQPATFNPMTKALAPANGDLGSKFLPFDLESYNFSQARGVQSAQLARLNRAVLDTQPTDAIRDLILGWYQGVPGGSRTNFHHEYVPAGWNSEVVLYRDMFKATCRMCHTSRQNTGTYFDTAATFTAFSPTYQVCDGLVMPNAQRAFSVFWGSLSADKIRRGLRIPNQPAVFTNALGYGGPCPKP